MVADAGRPEPTLPGGPRRPTAHRSKLNGRHEPSLACGPGRRYIAARQPAGGRCPPPRLRDRSFSIPTPGSPPRVSRPRVSPDPLSFLARPATPPRDPRRIPQQSPGPLPRRQRPIDPLTLGGNNNGVAPTAKSKLQKDVERILELELSGKVDADELLSYLKPVALHQQGDKIDPVNDGITSVINDMAMDRRELLQMKLRKMIIEARQREISKALVCRPGKIQEMQGQICELKGRYVRIPPRLVTPVELLP